jgi:diguanylate cyclase (GGDEF)-like protein/PAS domain S-box-containing protein
MKLTDQLLNHIENETQLRMLIDLIQEFIVLKDGQGRWLVSNKIVLDMYELGGYHYVGKTDIELSEISPKYKEPFEFNMRTDELAWENGSTLRIEKSFNGPDGVLNTWEVIKTPIFDEAGRRHRMIIVSRNISERKKVELALQASEKKYRLITENMNDIISVFDADGTIRYVSPSFEHILGYSSVDFIEKNIFHLIHPDDYENALQFFNEMLHNKKSKKKVEFRYQHTEGDYIWFEATFSCICKEDGELDHVIGSARDIMDRKKYEQLLQKMAYHDPLTAIPNRRFFMEQLEREITAADHRGSSLALLYLDVDHFKHINDTLGHEVGDELLTHFVQRIQSSLRLTDTIARLGGDEFVIILSDVSTQEQAAFIAERICVSLQQPWELSANKLISTSSIGVALYPQHGTCAQSLLRHADEALYIAKREGRCQVRFFGSEKRG